MSNAASGSFLTPKVEARECVEKGGSGVFALEPIKEGELVAVWGGRVVGVEAAMALSPFMRRYVVQVEDRQYLAPLETIEPADCINHCCRSNCGLKGQITLVAMRDIAPGEEICFDYATTDSSRFLEFECACGHADCRGRVSADDWKMPVVQNHNRGHFAPYLQRRIDEMAAQIWAATRLRRPRRRGGRAALSLVQKPPVQLP